MFIFSVVLQSLLILYFVFSGIAKVAGAKYWAEIFEHLKLPQWFRVVTGFVQLVGAAVLILGYWYTGAVLLAGIWLGMTMLMACLAHVRANDPIDKTSPAIVFAVLNITLIMINSNDFMLFLS